MVYNDYTERIQNIFDIENNLYNDDIEINFYIKNLEKWTADYNFFDSFIKKNMIEIKDLKISIMLDNKSYIQRTFVSRVKTYVWQGNR